jgi:hypothetical protein
MNLKSTIEQREKGTLLLGPGSLSPRLHDGDPGTGAGALALRGRPEEGEKAYAGICGAGTGAVAIDSGGEGPHVRGS